MAVHPTYKRIEGDHEVTFARLRGREVELMRVRLTASRAATATHADTGEASDAT